MQSFHHSSFRLKQSILPLLLILLFVIALVVVKNRQPELPREPLLAARTASGQLRQQLRAVEQTEKLHNWLQQQSGDISAENFWTPERVARGLGIARERRSWMGYLIKNHPQVALRQALRYDEWLALPESIKAEVEQPFSAIADLHVFPVCVAPGQSAVIGAPTYIAELEWADGTVADAYLFGARLSQQGQKNSPLQGIRLDGAAAVHEYPVQLLDDREIVAATSLFEKKQSEKMLNFASGVVLGNASVTALFAGHVVTFASAEECELANQRLADLDAQPGKIATSFYAAKALNEDDAGAVNWEELEQFAQEQATEWTETKKTVFLIRVTFPDNSSPVVSQANALAVINGQVSDAIRSYSYNKTYIEAGVSANLYTLPQNATYYSNGGGEGLNAELLRDARNTFRANKSGSDAAINIGPNSMNSYGDGGGLGLYDIVGVTFANANMVSGGISYAGLAGGGNLWMQNNNSADVYIHEFGHNYGIGHASSWGTTDGSVVGASGSSTEYGDIFDVMGSGDDPAGHFHTQAKVQLNWLSAAQWNNATTEGSKTYRIYGIDDSSTNPTFSRGVRITKAAAPAEYYWLGYRPAYLDQPSLQKGVYLNWQRPSQSRSWLLDSTPNSALGKKDAAITLGRTYSDAAAAVHVTPLSVGGTGANRWIDVMVNLGNAPGNHAPVAGVIQGPATIAARSDALYEVNATDADNDALAYYWNTQDQQVKDNSPALQHSWIVGGNYTVETTVSDMKGGKQTVSKIVAVSDPIDTWVQQTSGSTGYLRCALWANGRFVVVDYFGAVMNSWDGATWVNAGNLPDFDKEPRLAYGSQVFVAVGKKTGAAATQICYSADGRTWSVATFPAGIPQMRDVEYAQGKFVAVGDDGNVLSSVDGITWSYATVATAPAFRVLSHNGTVWLAGAYLAGGSALKELWTSADAVTWTKQPDLSFDLQQVIARNGVFYATGWYAGIKYSLDHGASWKNAAIASDGQWSTSEITVCADGTLVAGARNQSMAGTPQSFLVSKDGVNWQSSNAGADFAYTTQVLFFGDGRLYSTSDGGLVRRSNSFYPNNTAPVATFAVAPAAMAARDPRLFLATASDADGDSLRYTWDFGTAELMSDGASLSKTFNFGGSYTVTVRVADGKGGHSVLTKTITVSDPLRTFTSRTSGTTKNLQAIANNGSLAVAVGGNSGIILTSPDGITWTQRTVTSPGNKTFYSICWDGSKFIAVGADYNFTISKWVGIIYTSTDGTIWISRYLSATGDTTLKNCVGDGAGGAVAVGDNGTILQSPDGLNWTSVEVPALASTTLAGVTYGAGTFVISGYAQVGSGSGKLFTSSNRINWADQSLGMGLASWHDMRKIAWLNNRFVGSGWYSRLRSSTDGGQTFTTTRKVDEETPALAYGDQVYFAAGIDRSNGYADVDLLSLDGTNWSSGPAPTASDRNGATWFKHTFLTVGNGGEIWQSADSTPAASNNHAPTFAGYATATPYQSALTISAAQLLTAVADSDGDPVYLCAVAAVSSQNGRAEIRAGALYYAPPMSFNGTDHFMVTIADEKGATVQGLVTVIVGSGAPSVSITASITMLPSGHAQLSFVAIPGQNYLLQRSLDLQFWSDLTTVTAALGTGAIFYTDTTAPAGSAFYRIATP